MVMQTTRNTEFGHSIHQNTEQLSTDQRGHLERLFEYENINQSFLLSKSLIHI